MITRTSSNIMSVDQWEVLLTQWANGPSQTEQDKCDNAVRMVKAALSEYEPLQKRAIEVFAQGSYRNRTNVRQDSDVDVCVLCSDTFYFEVDRAPGATRELLGISPASYDFPEYKNDIRSALVRKFGSAGVSQGDKAFDVHENTYRVAADVVPAFEGRDYLPDAYGGFTYLKGTVLKSERSGRLIYNWPEQHYDNGVAKHTATARQFKKKVRILKRLRYKLQAEGFDVGSTTSSYLLESLVYNCPAQCFSQALHFDDIRALIVDLWEQTNRESSERSMVEVNEIKYLFHPTQPWTLADTRTCLRTMWQYIGFE